jgi:hypothetical protein
MRAVELFEAGHRQADVAADVAVSVPTAPRWYRTWQGGGRDALVRAAQLGRTWRLSDEQVAEVEAVLNGPKANGFGTDMWTLVRVALHWHAIGRGAYPADYPCHAVAADCEILRGTGDPLQGSPSGVPNPSSRKMESSRAVPAVANVLI